MTPEQQIREALEAVVGGHTSGAIARASARTALAALARLVAERDEARQDAEDSARLAYEANEHEKVLEGREAALRKALARIERNAENNGDEFTRMLAKTALGGGS